MEFGFYLPDSGPLATPDVIATLATRAEEMGFEILAMGDHVVMPRGIESTYPYEADGKWPGEMDCMEMLTTLAFVAARTSRAKLLSSVIVLPYRAPVFTAKILATLDVLSAGRLIAGCGVGWMAEEFEALQSPPYRERGAVSDEYIDVFKTLWASDTPSYDGEYCKFADIVFEPKPVQKPHPPIWIGGESGPALRRTARIADAWYPVSSNPRFPVATVEQLGASVARIKAHAEQIGRNPDEIGIAYNPSFYNAGEAELDAAGQRIAFTGSHQQIADDIKRFEAAGVGHLILVIRADSVDGWLAALDVFADGIRPLASA